VIRVADLEQGKSAAVLIENPGEPVALGHIAVGGAHPVRVEQAAAPGAGIVAEGEEACGAAGEQWSGLASPSGLDGDESAAGSARDADILRSIG